MQRTGVISMNPDRLSLSAALMTPRGRGAVTTVSIRGDHARHDRESGVRFHAANGRPLSQQPFGRIVFGRWGNEATEDVVLCRIDANSLEIHCHGGDTASKRILEDWRELGADVISWEEMIRVATDLLDAEFQTCLTRAATWRTAEQLLRQADGRLHQVSVTLENVEWSAPGRKQIQAQIGDLLQWSEFGLHLTQPWRVVLTGRPNVGKSSLINALLGYERSIVFDQPGTTRDVVTAVTAFDGWPVELSDTAGMRDDAEHLEAAGIERAREQLMAADLVVVVDDGLNGQAAGEKTVQGIRECRFSSFRRPPLVVANKSDVPGRWNHDLPANMLRVSAKTGMGLSELQQAIIQQLVPDVPAADVAYPVTERQIDCLRAALMAAEQNDAVSFQAAIKALCGRWGD